MTTLRSIQVRGLRLAALALVMVPLVASSAMGGPPEGKQETWQKALTRLRQTEVDSAAEVMRVVKDIDKQFDDGGKAVRPFVEDVLGFTGKMKYAQGGAEQLTGMFTRLIDSGLGTTLSSPPGPDSFTIFARQRFVDNVFDPEACKRSVSGAVERYTTRLQSLEGKLLVDLEADLPDSELRFSKQIPVVKLTEAMLAHADRAVDEAIAEAGTDFAVTAGKFAISEVGSNMISPVLVGAGAAAMHYTTTANDPVTTVATIAIGFPVGWLINKGLNTALDAVGHDPAGKMAHRVATRLAHARNALIEGSKPEQNPRYVLMYLYQLGHPDETVRTMCTKAVDQLEKEGGLGLLPRLQTMHVYRNCLRRAAIYRLIFGTNAPIPDDLYLDVEQAKLLDSVVKWAREAAPAATKRELDDTARLMMFAFPALLQSLSK